MTPPAAHGDIIITPHASGVFLIGRIQDAALTGKPYSQMGLYQTLGSAERAAHSLCAVNSCVWYAPDRETYMRMSALPLPTE